MTNDGSSGSSKPADEGRARHLEEPIGLVEALRDRYVSPWRRIYERIRPTKKKIEVNNRSNDGIGAGLKGVIDSRSVSDQELSKEPLPESIVEAWRIGLGGADPSRFSRLRTRAATPLPPVPAQPVAAAIASNERMNESAPSVDEAVHKGIKDGANAGKKKSLLQSYLELDKRSQKIISFSVFIWSLSGVIYFTWFSPFDESLAPTPNTTLSPNILRSSSSRPKLDS